MMETPAPAKTSTDSPVKENASSEGIGRIEEPENVTESEEVPITDTTTRSSQDCDSKDVNMDHPEVLAAEKGIDTAIHTTKTVTSTVAIEAVAVAASKGDGEVDASTSASTLPLSKEEPVVNVFHPKGNTILEGDFVIIYMSRDATQAITVTPGQTLSNRYGRFSHDDMIGKQWGSQLKNSTKNSTGFVHLLKPTPSLWTLSLPHRTQILYLPDIAFLTSYLDIKPGSTVLEAGTGSGSFSHSLAATVGQQGRIFTFEFHQERYEKAKLEFERHNLAPKPLILQHRNVCKDGFGVQVEGEVDSVFLDLPSPWEAIPHAKTVFKRGKMGRICCFSPCIEQVLKTVTALNENKFSEIITYETLVQNHIPSPHSAPNISTAVERLKAVEIKKERRREIQIETARLQREKKNKAVENGGGKGEMEMEQQLEVASSPPAKRKRMEGGEGEGEEDREASGFKEEAKIVSTNSDPPPPTKKAKLENNEMDSSKVAQNGADDVAGSSVAAVTEETGDDGQRVEASSGRKPIPSIPTRPGRAYKKVDADGLACRPSGYLRGHTSFLTFAMYVTFS